MIQVNCKTDAWWENVSNSKVPESDWEDDFCVSKSFYELCNKLHPDSQKKQNRLRTPTSVEDQLASFLIFFQCRKKKTKIAFVISRVSASAMIKRVSHAITNFLGPEFIKPSTTENNVKEHTNLRTREFLQCMIPVSFFSVLWSIKCFKK